MKRLLKFQVRAFAIATILFVSISSVFAQQKIAIIDAGSSGSRLYVYDISNNGKQVNILCDEKLNIPLSKVAVQKDSVDSYVNKILSLYDKKTNEKIDLYVLATAGMRMIDSTDAKSIYRYIATATIDSNYQVKKAMTISGRYEGFYAWIAAYYEEIKLGFSNSTSEKPLTYTGTPFGIIEIGGASMQIAFAANRTYGNTIFRKGFYIYSKSYLGGGFNEFEKESKTSLLSNEEIVVKGLGEIKSRSQNINFLGIGWAFGALLNDTTKENASKKKYVDKICTALGKVNSEIKNIESTWTKGAAIDIVINKAEPERFDYANPN